MPNRVRILTGAGADRARLDRMARDRGAPGRGAERARIVLLSAQGLTGPQIAERVGCSEPTVVKWRGPIPGTRLAGPVHAPPPRRPACVPTPEEKMGRFFASEYPPSGDLSPIAGHAL